MKQILGQEQREPPLVVWQPHGDNHEGPEVNAIDKMSKWLTFRGAGL